MERADTSSRAKILPPERGLLHSINIDCILYIFFVLKT